MIDPAVVVDTLDGLALSTVLLVVAGFGVLAGVLA